MAVQNLHEAAVVLEGAYKAIDRLLQETAPMQMAYFEERAALRPMSGEDENALWTRTGYSAFWDSATRLIELLQTVDEVDNADANRRFLDA